MRSLTAPALAVLAVVLPAPSALAGSGGTAAPGGGPAPAAKAPRGASGAGGGAVYGSNVPRPATRPVAARLTFASQTAVVGRALPAVRFRIDQRGMKRVRARVVLQRIAGRAPVVRRSAGWVATGRSVSLRWPKGATAPLSGRYLLRLHVTDSRGRTLKRTANRSGRAVLRVRPAPVRRPALQGPVLMPTPAPAPSPGGPGVFPVAGTFSFGGAGSRFGTARDGHAHQGQDIAAAAGTPVVAPYAGTVSATAFQASAAGEYVVLDAVDGRDYFFAHCVRGSTSVQSGQAVAAGTRLCGVGSTGRSTGPHLHFEIWVGGWRVPGGLPIDPLPELQAWAQR